MDQFDYRLVLRSDIPMLEVLHLRNFQAHRSLKIQFGKRVTTLIGRTDAGKSAVIRALSAVCRNSPGGTGFITKGEEKCVIQLQVDGRKVTRIRSKTRNEYRLDSQKFAAFGTGVPAPIAEFLNLTDDNFQLQLDPIFWFSQSASQVGKDLNELVNLELVDRMTSNVAAKIRTKNAEIRVLKEQVESATEKAEKLSYVPKMLKALTAVREKETRRQEMARECEILDKKIGEAAGLSKRAKAAGEAGIAGGAAEEAGLRLIAIGAKKDKLRRLIADCTEAKKRSDAQIPEDAFDAVRNLRSDADKVSVERRGLSAALKEYETLQGEAGLCDKKLTDLEKQLAEAEKEGLICPECKRPLDTPHPNT